MTNNVSYGHFFDFWQNFGLWPTSENYGFYLIYIDEIDILT